jgi:hypothetical protein
MVSRLIFDISPHARFGIAMGAALFALQGCQTQPLPPLSGFASCTPRPGGGTTTSTVTMPEEGIIVVIWPTYCLDTPESMRIVRSAHPDAFNSWVELVGGIEPGEAKLARVFEGYLRMNDDRSITYNEPGNPHAPPFEMTLRPGDARYDELIARVGGLSPGERKMVTRAPD